MPEYDETHHSKNTYGHEPQSTSKVKKREMTLEIVTKALMFQSSGETKEVSC